MAYESLGRVYFTDGHTEDVMELYKHIHPGILSIKTESGIYVRVAQTEDYLYYKSRVNKDWETVHTRVDNIDHVELK